MSALEGQMSARNTSLPFLSLPIGWVARSMRIEPARA